ncbi:hypothetical protein [Nannocystis punicea]|uniref:PEGA domain-containing protein n=1 Tax=Nannocystis punicea TaxID=2995304 RepID=A0ABY7H3X7_9BACT|nr:hypothetical protein [Nannocystis poenicansa]WAS93975.1 hypothetical protein O0S08_48200 [Nannocystis poenicansa]
MSSPTDRLTVVPTRRPWALWLSLPLVGAAVAAVLLLVVLPRVGSQQTESPDVPASTAAPTQPQPQRPETVVWFVATDPVGATVTLDKGPESVLAALAPQLEGRVTPLRLVVPFDDQAQVQVTMTHPGYKPSKRSLIPMNNENLIVELQPDAPAPTPTLAPVTNTLASPNPKKKPPSAKTPAAGASEPTTAPASKSEKGEESELKDEPIFSPAKGGG